MVRLAPSNTASGSFYVLGVDKTTLHKVVQTTAITLQAVPLEFEALVIMTLVHAWFDRAMRHRSPGQQP